MKKKICIFAAVLSLFMGPVFHVYAQDPRQEAMDLLAEAHAEGCRVCRERLQARAFEILDHVYYPDLEIAAQDNCLFEKSELDNQLVFSCGGEEETDDSDYPLVTFLFHTKDKHLVGINPRDFTPDDLAQAVNQAPADARFKGRILVLAYPYGDGDAFNYYPSANHLQVHCKLLTTEILTD